MLKRAWLRVPKINTAALGLFRKLGFAGTKDSPVCSSDEESAARNLECTTVEIESLETSHRSRFARWVREITNNWEFSDGMADTTDRVYADRYWVPTMHPYLTKEIYTKTT